MYILNLGIAAALYYFIVFSFSISIHESAHALAAYYLGDSTGKDLGRITIKPNEAFGPGWNYFVVYGRVWLGKTCTF